MVKYIVLFLYMIILPLRATSKEEIRSRIENVLSKLPATTNIGLMIYNPLLQDTILSLNHTLSMIPASNTKLFTTAAALTIMGGEYILSTKLLTDDSDLNDEIINGNLYIKGFGNSIFSEADLDNMVTDLRNMGIIKITGNVIGDDTFFDNIYSRDDWISDEVANVKLPPISALVIDRNREIIYKKKGKGTRSYIINIEDPPLYAASLLRTKLLNAGIEVENNAIKGEAPFNAVVVSEKGVLLRELIKTINKESDNFLAECLFKTIGAAATGKQGNSFYSTQAILDFIDDNAIYSTGTAVLDGSGISRFDQITVGAIAGLLEKMYFDLANFEDFYNSLSIAGIDGTLKRRLIGTTAENNFHGKTGTLNGVSSLSGYLTCPNGEDLIISIFFEFTKGGANLHRDIQDEIVQILSDWD